MENQDSVDRVALVGKRPEGGCSAPLVLKKLFAEGPGGALKIGQVLVNVTLEQRFSYWEA